jgi:hypothetical protein
MAFRSAYLQSVVLLGIAAIWSAVPIATMAQGSRSGAIGTIEVADPTRPSDGTIHPAAAAAMAHGPLPASAAEAEPAAGLDGRAHRQIPRPGTPHLLQPAAPQALRELFPLSEAAGEKYPKFTPSSANGAKGPSRYVQEVNRLAAIFDAGLAQSLFRSPLTTLAGLHRSIPVQGPQMIWDPNTNRFYYAMSASAGASENRIAFGFSKTANPNNLTSDWCKYTYIYASRFLDQLSLGDNQNFIIFSGNAFQPSYVGSDINAISKPRPGTTCPGAGSFKKGFVFNIRDSGGVLASSPVAANQIDDLPTGYVAARHGSGILDLPSNKLWFFNVTRNSATGNPVFSSARQLTVPTYGFPPVATQTATAGKPLVTLRTLDARLGQAVQARNPRRKGPPFFTSLWTQHTVRHTSESRSIIRWYEINPESTTPVVLRTGTVGEQAGSAGTFYFNGAISPDRRVHGATKEFGDSFVINYNFSSAANNINPSIGVASSFRGRPLTFRTVRRGVAPYHDLSCPNNGDVCNWGGAAAAPDPRPAADRPRPTAGVVWGTNQYSGVRNPRPDRTDWRTWIFAHQP